MRPAISRSVRGVLLLTACGAAPDLPHAAPAACEGIERVRGTMGTLARVRVCDAAAPGAAESAEAALDAIDRVDRVMSLYKAESDLSRLNREGYPGPVSLDPWLIDLLARSARLSKETRGRFDVTVKPLMDHYGFYRELGFAPPPGGLRGALRATGMSGLVVDEARGEARFRRQYSGVDLGGVAKGYALDRAGEVLRQRGAGRALLELGRSFLFLGEGPADGGRWPVAIADPRVEGALAGCFLSPPGSLSSSAPSGRVIQGSEGAVGHILDPRRGAAEARALQATVWSPEGTRAEAWSKAALLLKAQSAGSRLARHGEWAILLEAGEDPAGPLSALRRGAESAPLLSSCEGAKP